MFEPHTHVSYIPPPPCKCLFPPSAPHTPTHARTHLGVVSPLAMQDDAEVAGLAELWGWKAASRVVQASGYRHLGGSMRHRDGRQVMDINRLPFLIGHCTVVVSSSCMQDVHA